MVWFCWGCTASCGWNVRCVGVRGDAWSVMLSPCNTPSLPGGGKNVQHAEPLDDAFKIYTEKATKARHRQERQKQRHNQNHQQTNQATPKQPTNSTTNLCTKHPTHHTHQPAGCSTPPPLTHKSQRTSAVSHKRPTLIQGQEKVPTTSQQPYCTHPCRHFKPSTITT